MSGFLQLLRTNRNYRATWLAQLVSEVGDNFNNIAVFGLVMDQTHSGMAVGGVMLARAVGMLLASPIAGVSLDRFDRRRVMVISDLVRALIALCFLLTIQERHLTLMFVLSALLMFASPFFTAGRGALLPAIATREELHTANSLTQTTAWTSVALGSFLGGGVSALFGYEAAFCFNALSFVISAAFISSLRPATRRGFRPTLEPARPARRPPLEDYIAGLRYMRRVPLLFAIALVGVGWATGGGAAQILFGLFGEIVFHRGAGGIGLIWGCAGIGLVLGGLLAHLWGRRLSFAGYQWTISIGYAVHGGAYVLFALSPTLGWALVFIALSRLAAAVCSVLNMTQVLRCTADAYRGRVLATVESMVWATMMFSLTGASYCSTAFTPRQIGVAAGILSSLTALGWGWAQCTGRLPEPAGVGAGPAAGEEVEVAV
jgi:MFS family permease